MLTQNYSTQRLTAVQGYLLLALLLIIFVVLKLPYLQLPYYWDEGWVYAPAIQLMDLRGLSLAPDALPADYGRGHPLLFHFLGGLWLRLFGYSIVSAHAFALTIALTVLWIIYRIATRLFYQSTGIVAVLFVMTQSIFFAQSVLVLPEILLVLFMLLALYYYVQKQWLWYGLSAAAAILTKESAIVLFAALSLHTSIIWLRHRTELRSYLFQLFYINIPLSLWIGFLIWQKVIYGWYFFPLHIGLTAFSPDIIWEKLQRGFCYIFFYQGRNALLGGSLLALIIIAIRKAINSLPSTWFIVSSIFFVIFLVMCSVNFYTERYLISLIVLFAFAGAAIITHPILPRWLAVFIVLFTLLSSANAYINMRTVNDHNPGYKDGVRVMLKAVDYLTNPDRKKHKVYSPFLLMKNLTDTLCGYVTPTNHHMQVSNTDTTGATYFVLSNFDAEILLKFDKPEQAGLMVLEEFTSDKAIVKICVRSPLKPNTQ